jgi:isoprenylcysteine carboxyl methyltransferase (ICMT) family protein YpbQ
MIFIAILIFIVSLIFFAQNGEDFVGASILAFIVSIISTLILSSMGTYWKVYLILANKN